MWPWGHLGLGYLLYSGLRRWRGGQPQGAAVPALLLGTQVPDLVDKPLAWTFAVLPTGRSLAHSLVIALATLGVFTVVVTRLGHRRVGLAFSFGYLSQLAGDALYPLLAGEFAHLSFLAWPLLPAVEYPTKQSFWAHLLQLEFGLAFWFEMSLFGLAIILWYRDGRPGTASWHRWRRRRVQTEH